MHRTPSRARSGRVILLNKPYGVLCQFTDPEGRPTLADCCLIPQIFNARRFNVSLDHLPKLLRAEASCAKLEAFAAAHPARQPDAQ